MSRFFLSRDRSRCVVLMCKPRRWLMSVKRSCGCWGSKHNRISMAFSTELGRDARTDGWVVLGMLRSPPMKKDKYTPDKRFSTNAFGRAIPGGSGTAVYLHLENTTLTYTYYPGTTPARTCQ